MKIKKYQSGGLAYIPTFEVWGDNGSPQISNDTSKKEDKVNTELAKGVIDVVKENGLNSDVSVFLNQVSNILDQNKLTPYGTANEVSFKDLIKIQMYANRVKENNSLYESVEKNLTNENTWSEVATDARGNLYVENQETHKIDIISPNTYKHNSNKYLPLTNRDLIEIRRNSPAFAYRTDILTDAGSSVGLKTVIDFAKNLINEFGKTSITGYGEKKSNQIRTGLDHLVSGDIGGFNQLLETGPDGYYKISNESTVVDSNIEAALEYLIASMPSSYRNALVAKSSVEGYDPAAMLLRMMYINTDRSTKIDYDTSANKVDANGNSKSDKVELDYLMNIADYDFGERYDIILRPASSNPNDRAEVRTVGWKKGALVDSKGDMLPERYNLKLLKSKAEAFLAGDTSAITFGDQLVSSEDLEKIVWDGLSEIVVVQLPWKTENGKKMPDLSALKELDKLNEWKKNSQPSQLELNEYINSMEIAHKVVWSEDLQSFIFKPNAVMPFINIQAVANGKTYDKAKDSYENGWLEKVDKSQGRDMVDWYDNAVQYGKEYPHKGDYQNDHMKDAKAGRFYRGNIFIPIENSIIALSMRMKRTKPADYVENPSEKAELARTTMQAAEAAAEQDRKSNTTFKTQFEK